MPTTSSYQGGQAYGAAPVQGFVPQPDVPQFATAPAGSFNPAPAGPNNGEVSCTGANSDILWNLCLLLAVCAFEAVLAMVCGSFTLMLDFYRRLASVFAMVYTLETVQSRGDVTHFNGTYIPRGALAEIHASTNPAEQQSKVEAAAMALRHADSRRRILAALMISCYLVTVAFTRAMGGIASMYGGAPDSVSSAGWVLVAGCLCLALDTVHVLYGVEIVLHNLYSDEHTGKFYQFLLVSYGSLIVIFEAFLDIADAGGYASPIISLVLAGVIAYVESDTVTKTSSAMQTQDWKRR